MHAIKVKTKAEANKVGDVTPNINNSTPVILEPVETDCSSSRKRKKKEKKTRGNYSCDKCLNFFADSSKKLQVHKQQCNYLQEYSKYVAERDLLLVEKNELNEYCCKACKFNFKSRKDNLFAHVQNNRCPKGAIMPPKPVKPNAPQLKEHKTTRKIKKVMPSSAEKPTIAPKPSSTDKPPTKNEQPKTTVTLTSMETTFKILNPLNETIKPTDYVELSITAPDKMCKQDFSSVNNFNINIALANDTIGSKSDNSCTSGYDTPFEELSQDACSVPAAVTTTYPQGMLEFCAMSYAPSYFPSYSKYAEFSPTSVPFQEMIGTFAASNSLPTCK